LFKEEEESQMFKLRRTHFEVAFIIIVFSLGLFKINFGLSWKLDDIDFTLNRNMTIFAADEDSMELVIGVDNTKLSSYTDITDLIITYEGRIVNTVAIGGVAIAIVADVPLNYVSSFREELQRRSLTRYVEPNIGFQISFTPNDPLWSYQWAPQKINADWAWNKTTGLSSILVALIDTGVDYTHEDLSTNYVPMGYDWVNNDPDPMDDHGHGTHCAGIIAATINNSVGIAGLAQVRIMAEKAFNTEGVGWEDDIANAIIHAVNQGADILSNSWGSPQDSYLIREAIRYAYDKGVLIVAAAGNDASSTEFYPAAYSEVIAVTATDIDDYPAVFTNFGKWVEVAAPGVNVLSTFLNNSYAFGTGTSMACPHVAGIAALVWSSFPDASRDWVRAQIRRTADDLGDVGFDVFYGYGRVNAEAAVAEAPPQHDILILSWEKPRYIRLGDVVWINVTLMNFGTEDEYDITVQLFVDGNLENYEVIASLASGATKSVSFLWAPLAGGMYNVTLFVVPVSGETEIENNVFSDIVSVMAIVLNPSSGPAGTKVLVEGVGFDPLSSLTLKFNDMALGSCITDEIGNFAFVFNIPFSTAGNQTVKVYYTEEFISAEFKVIDLTTLLVEVDVGSIHFIGEIVDFYVQTSLMGKAVNATIEKAVLYMPNGTSENINAQILATGFYKLTYTIPKNASVGEYVLVVEAEYVNDMVRASGTSFKGFLISPTLTDTDAYVSEIKENIATTVIPALGAIRLNLTAMNATLKNIFLKIVAINGTSVLIQTTIGIMNGTITEVNDNIATIIVPGLGQIQAEVLNLKEKQQKWMWTQYLALAFSFVIFFGVWLSIVLLIKLRKKPKNKQDNFAFILRHICMLYVLLL
jgi:subtilisin family serine protease